MFKARSQPRFYTLGSFKINFKSNGCTELYYLQISKFLILHSICALESFRKITMLMCALICNFNLEWRTLILQPGLDAELIVLLEYIYHIFQPVAQLSPARAA